MTGQSGQLGDAAMKAVGWSRDKCYAMNLQCWYDANPSAETAASCAARFKQELTDLRPRVIVALGVLASERFGLVDGVRMKASQLRGSALWNDEFNCWVIHTWQPAALFHAPDFIGDLVRDLAKIEYYLDPAKSYDFGRVDWELVTTAERAREVLDGYATREDRPLVALDVETRPDRTTKNKFFDEIRCLAVSDGTVAYTFTDEVCHALAPADWPNIRWVFHNAAFDSQMLKVDLGVDLPVIEDTMLMSYSLDERGGGTDEGTTDLGVGIHGLKRLAREYAGARFYDVNTWSCTDEELWPYNAKDAAYTARLANYFEQRQRAEEGTRGMYEQMLMPMVSATRDEKAYGVYCNPAAVSSLAQEWLHKWLRLHDELQTDALRYGWDKGEINLNSPVQKKRFFNTFLMLGVEDTKADTLKRYKTHPWVSKYQEWMRLDRMLNVYVIGLQEVLDADGRCHPDAYIHGTRTGRWSYHRPPLQTWPTGFQYYDADDTTAELAAEIQEYIKLRGFLGAPPGSLYIAADLEQAELWTMAYLSGDENMLEDLRTGDFHSNAAEKMFVVDRRDFDKDGWAQMRRESKYVTFGMAYGRGAKSLKEPGPGQQGQLDRFTLAECEQIVRRWHARYHKHYEWWQAQIRQARLSGEQISLSGRRRRYWAPGLLQAGFAPMCANWPVQTTSHDHIVLSHIDLWNAFQAGTSQARPLWDGHDALYFEVPLLQDASIEDNIAHVGKSVDLIYRTMSLPRYFEGGIPVEVKVGPNWTESEDWRAILDPSRRKPDSHFKPEWFLHPQRRAA